MTSNTGKHWELSHIKAYFDRPFLDVVYEAATVHRQNHDAREVQLCTLLSIKTGGCPEDCKYCPQSVHWNTDVEKEKLLTTEEVLTHARKAKDAGSTRFCMGAAWRKVNDGRAFDRVVEMVEGIKALGLEACCSLGTLSAEQAEKLAAAGVTSYNHNLDSSDEFYKKIITTRSYEERLQTLSNVMNAGISVCCGGIIGMGESVEDRMKLLHTLSQLKTPPGSIPINALVPVEGTPLESVDPMDPFDWIRTIAVTRILFPKAMVRLSAGRLSLSKESQALAFMAGANSIFTGDKLLTTGNPDFDFDKALLDSLGLRGRPPQTESQDHVTKAA